MRTAYEGYKQIYTGGSKNEAGVGAAAVCGKEIRTGTLPNQVSIYTAEIYAIKLAFDIIEDTEEGRILICSDSQSALRRLKTYKEDDHIIRQFQHYVYARKLKDCVVEFCWLPGHANITGNKRVEAAAKQATRGISTLNAIPYTDYYRQIKEKMKME